MNKIIGAILGLIIFMFITVPVYFLHGFVIVKLWCWFLVPYGLAPVSFSQAVGIGLIVGFLTNQYVPKPKGEMKRHFAYLYLSPLLTLLVGYIVTWFI